MSEIAEGIGGVQWGFEPTRMGTFLTEGKNRLAEVTTAGMRYKMLLATAPELWDAANEVIKALESGVEVSQPQADALHRLRNVVAKAVGKTDWKDVAQ